MAILALPINELAIIKSQKHPFHILRPSTFPISTSFFLFCWLVPQVFSLHGLPFAGSFQSDLIHLSITGLVFTLLSWFLAILKESRHGFHTKKVQGGLRLGMLLFIASEVMFFFAFFWAFFHYSLVPSVATGAIWPPVGTQAVNAWGLPLVNTLLLLTSGFTITIAHAYILKGNSDGFFWYLFLTVLLGSVFLFCQAYEYTNGIKFSWRDNVYGSIFFVTTGFHGFHVTIGTLFLTFCWLRHFFASILPSAKKMNFSIYFLSLFGYTKREAVKWSFTPNQHFGFEAAAWYWHFVDVVWLFLFLTVYWWGSS